MQTVNDPRAGHTSASNALEDSLCAGRHTSQKGIPEPKSNDADFGQAIHDALRSGDDSKLSFDQREIFDACKTIEQRLVEKVFGEEGYANVLREERFWMTCNGHPHSGQVDVVYRGKGVGLIIDYKTLPGDVPDSSSNLQLRDLACLVSHRFIMVKGIATAIVQPLVTHSPEVCMYDAADLERAKGQMAARVVASNAQDAKRVAGEAQCKYCLAKAHCSEYAKWSGAIVSLVIDDTLLRTCLFGASMSHWTPDQRRLAAAALSPAKQALDVIRDFLKDGLKSDPAFIPGYELSKGRETTKITDPQTCFARFNALGGSLDDFMKCVNVGNTKLKEAVHTVTGKSGKHLAAIMGHLGDGISETSTSEPSFKKVEK